MFRTVVSYGEQMMNLSAILTMICIEGICLLRLILGPLSESWCWWLLFFNQSVPIIALLVFDAYYLARVSTVFENHRKSLIQHCERSELPLHFELTKVH